MDGLNTVLDQLNRTVSDEQLSKLNLYADELNLWGKKINLTGSGGKDMLTRHFADCLAGVSYLPLYGAETLLDVGTGGGLPGIILAILYPELRVDLSERSDKKCGFLRSCKGILGLSNLSVHSGPFEQLKDKYDLITFRAFSPFTPKLIKSLRTILSDGGKVAAYKGKRSVIDEELATLETDPDNLSIISYSVPGLEDQERNMVVFSLRLE